MLNFCIAALSVLCFGMSIFNHLFVRGPWRNKLLRKLASCNHAIRMIKQRSLIDTLLVSAQISDHWCKILLWIGLVALLFDAVFLSFLKSDASITQWILQPSFCVFTVCAFLNGAAIRMVLLPKTTLLQITKDVPMLFLIMTPSVIWCVFYIGGVPSNSNFLYTSYLSFRAIFTSIPSFFWFMVIAQLFWIILVGLTSIIPLLCIFAIVSIGLAFYKYFLKIVFISSHKLGWWSIMLLYTICVMLQAYRS